MSTGLGEDVVRSSGRQSVGTPTGAVTLLFSDIEGSTRLWEDNLEAMSVALARHNDLMRSTIERWHGYVFKTVGDSFCAAFSDPSDGVEAALAAQQALAAEVWPEPVTMRVRMGLHTGVCEERDGDYYGPTVNRTARLAATAHGGQTVLSATTAELVRDSVPEGVVMRDLGEHRLKDLGRPERVFQVDAQGLGTEFPPLRSLDNPELGNNLPVQLTSFIGRQAELGEVRTLLEGSRLVTLTGAGGSGKSRLALQAAVEQLDESGQGVWLVELGSLAEPELVAASVASVLRLRQEPGRSMLETLLGVLRDEHLLLLLDNCEHLLNACAPLAEAILRSCSRITILATSREPLGVGGERVYRIPSLLVPPTSETTGSAEVRGYDAVRLFVERAVEHQPHFVLDDTNFQAVASICRRLDGMPLAIELAAARLSTLSVADIDERLGDRFRLLTGGSRTALPRQRTLRALIDWSYDLLNQIERAAFARLSVFAGGWSLRAAEVVCAGRDLESVNVLDVLGSLVDKSLVQTELVGTTVRYRLLETIREYAADQLLLQGAAEVTEARGRHAREFLKLAETGAPHMAGADYGVWLTRLEQEHDNIRAAAAHLLADEATVDEALRMVIALYEFWFYRAYFEEGVETLEEALRRPDAPQSPALRAAALTAAGKLHYDRGDHAAGEHRLEEGLAIARRLGDLALAADSLEGLGWLEFRQGDHRAARVRADEAVTLAREAGHSRLIAHALNLRGTVLDEIGDRAGARADLAEALARFQDAGDRRHRGTVLNNLAILDLNEGNLDAARAHLDDALVSAQGSGDIGEQLNLYCNLGWVTLLQGDPSVSHQHFTDTLLRARRSGSRTLVAYAILGTALCASALGDEHRAAVLHGAADRLLEGLGESLEALEADLRERDQSNLRQTMGTDVFASAVQSGSDLGSEDAIALALETP